MGPLTHIWRMRVLLQLILPLLVQGKSIVKERNGVIKQALIPTLVNIIGHARMQEHGIGDDMDGLLNFMDEEKILDPFLSWLAWFTNLVVDKEEGKSEEEAEESSSVVKERNDVIKQALTPTLVNIVRHARMQEHGTDIDNLLDYMDEEKILDPFLKWLGWFTDTIPEGEEQGEDQAQEEKDDESDDVTESDEKVLELEVLKKEKIKLKKKRTMNLMMSPNLMRKFSSLRFWKRKKAWKKLSKIWRKKRIMKRYHKKTMRKLSKKKSLRRKRVWRRT